MSILNDVALRELVQEHLTLLRKLAPVLSRAGPQHPDRSKENTRRTALRRQLRRQLHDNEKQIVTYVMNMFRSLTPEE
jgi:uncharacterized protein involved in exopolysaccharide biosynthesis